MRRGGLDQKEEEKVLLRKIILNRDRKNSSRRAYPILRSNDSERGGGGGRGKEPKRNPPISARGRSPNRIPRGFLFARKAFAIRKGNDWGQNQRVKFFRGATSGGGNYCQEVGGVNWGSCSGGGNLLNRRRPLGEKKKKR